MEIKKLQDFIKESVSNEEIVDCFIDYFDADSLKIKDGWIDGDQFVEKKEYFSKSDLTKTRKAKLVKIKIGEYTGGIRIDGNYYESSMPLSTIKDITKAFEEINRFSEITDQEITFSISNRSDNIYLCIIIPLDFVKEGDLNADVVNGFLKDIKLALDKTPSLGKKRKKLSNNWLEMSFSDWRECIGWGNEIVKMNDNGTRWEELNKIGEKILKSGWKVVQTGGDKQLVIQLKKI